MKGRIVATLFGLPFFAVGVFMLWSIGSTFYDTLRMQSWAQIEARLVRGGYATHSGSDADTYVAYAEYTYSYGGERFKGNRVSLSSSGDNLGEYQRDMGRRLQGAAAKGGHILVYVNPERPSESIIDREVRWGLIGFKSIFLFVFGGFGLGLIIVVWRAAPEKDADDPRYKDAPWLRNDDWQTPTIRSSSKTAMRGAWAFAIFWNLISAALPFLVYQEVTRKENYMALIGLLFPLVGAGLLIWAIQRTLEWRRFGAAPVNLDPFPGSIGGHVGGTIDLNIPFDSVAKFQLTLNCLHSYMSGSGKSRSRKEEAEWQDTLVAHAEQGAKGTRLTFRFDVPEGLDASDTDKDDSYYEWRLNLRAELAGTDLDRDYDIPVFPTAAKSRRVSEHAVRSSRVEQSAIDTRAIGEIIGIRNGVGGKQLIYPMGRNIGPAIGGIIVGVIFAAAGWYLVAEEGHTIFGSLFGGIGSLIGLFCFYLMLNSLEVSKYASEITTVRRLLGIPISREQLRQSDFVRFEKKSTMKSQSGGKHVIYYSIYGIGRRGEKILLGEGFKGENEAIAAIRIIATELGLSELRDHYDPLGADDFMVGHALE